MSVASCVRQPRIHPRIKGTPRIDSFLTKRDRYGPPDASDRVDVKRFNKPAVVLFELVEWVPHGFLPCVQTPLLRSHVVRQAAERPSRSGSAVHLCLHGLPSAFHLPAPQPQVWLLSWRTLLCGSIALYLPRVCRKDSSSPSVAGTSCASTRHNVLYLGLSCCAIQEWVAQPHDSDTKTRITGITGGG